MGCPARLQIVSSEDCEDRRPRDDVTLLLVWVGERAAADTHQYTVAGPEPTVRAQPRLERLTAVELEREQLVVPEECAGNDGCRRALMMFGCRGRGEAQHLGAEHHVHQSLECTVEGDVAKNGIGAPTRRLTRQKLHVADEIGDRPAGGAVIELFRRPDLDD